MFKDSSKVSSEKYDEKGVVEEDGLRKLIDSDEEEEEEQNKEEEDKEEEEEAGKSKEGKTEGKFIAQNSIFVVQCIEWTATGPIAYKNFDSAGREMVARVQW